MVTMVAFKSAREAIVLSVRVEEKAKQLKGSNEAVGSICMLT